MFFQPDEETVMSNELIDLTNGLSDTPTAFSIKIKPQKTSIDPIYCTNVENPQPGDLILGTLDDTKHPAKDDKHFGPRFLILGAVMGLIPVPIKVIQAWIDGVKFSKFAKKEKLEIVWQNIISGHERYNQIVTYNKSRFFKYLNYNNSF